MYIFEYIGSLLSEEVRIKAYLFSFVITKFVYAYIKNLITKGLDILYKICYTEYVKKS